MLMSNAMVWRYFVKGLHSSDDSTLVPTVIATASNFILSTLIGCLVFNENASFIGSALIFLGLVCIISEDRQQAIKEQ